MPLRMLKIVFAFLIAAWALTSLMTNLGGLGQTYSAVALVSSMKEVGAGAPPWRSEAPLLVWSGVLLLLFGKLFTAACCLIGGGRMWRARRLDGATFQQAKTFALLGGWAAVAWLFVGFAYFGEVIFFMYLGSIGFNVAETAFRCAGYIGLMMLFVGARD